MREVYTLKEYYGWENSEVDGGNMVPRGLITRDQGGESDTTVDGWSGTVD